ncbi:MAG TPA: hypothetical protein VGM75_32340 [Pseudonocardiaceae bacterium]
MPVTEDADVPTDDDGWHELAEHGLHHYTAQTANAVGTGPEAAWSEWPTRPAPTSRWRAGCPSALAGDVRPPPETVAAFVRAVLTGRHTDPRGRPSAAVSADLTRRLVDWAGHEPTLDNRTG